MTTTPRYAVGSIGPVSREHAEERAEHSNLNLRSERLLPPDVVQHYAGIGIKDYTPEGVEDGISRYWSCVDELMQHKLDRIGWGGLPISAQLGRTRCLALIEETQRKTGLPAGNDFEAVVAAYKHLGVTKIAVASRWADQLNHAVVRYFTDAGMEVLTITTAGQWAGEAFSMSLDTGIRLVFQLASQAMKQAPQAEGLFLPGGTWRSLGCMPHLEDDYGIPVVSNGTAQVWRLIHEGIAPPVKGWTRLLENA